MSEQPSLLLVISDFGSAELLADGVQVWASDDDPDAADELGDNFIGPRDVDKVLDYLEDKGVLTEDETEHIEVERPGLPDDEDDEDEDEDEDE